jgi:RNA polymerase sigma factor (sigma-70 family)
MSPSEPSSDDERGLRPLVAQLPPRQKTALVLRFYLGLTTAEIAEDMRISEATVRSTIARAEQTLRNKLALEQER